MAQQNASRVELLISDVNEENYYNFIDKYGLGFNDNLLDMAESDRVIYVMGELALYENVLSRSENLSTDVSPPPDLRLIQRDQLKDILLYYTNEELVEAYDPRNRWDSRENLINIIINDIFDGSCWSFTHRYCSNDNTINVMTGEQHGTIDKNVHMTLSYGTHKDYQCYQIEELD